MSSHIEASFNKFTGQGKGTLVGNWAEERSLRDFTGVGRTIVKSHIPKRHLQFDNPIHTDKVFDDTNQRIYGEKLTQQMISENQGYGKSYNPADNLPRIGRRTELMEAEIRRQVYEEEAQKKQAVEDLKKVRHFDTTTKSTHDQKTNYENYVGRRVMKTQDNKPVSLNEKDEQLIVEHGTWRRTQKCPDNDIYQRIPKGDYTQAQPVTFWTHALERKNFYMSAGTGPNPFARTSGFTQTADQTKAVAGFYGNVDFAKEKSQVDFRKTKGTDLNLGNPYVEQNVPLGNFQDITDMVIEVCKLQSPANVLRGLRVHFKRADDDSSGMLDCTSFKMGMRSYGIPLSEEQTYALMKKFDTGLKVKMPYNDMIDAMRGNMNEVRQSIVMEKYQKLDKRGGQTVTLGDLQAAYDVSMNPEVQFGHKSDSDVVETFMNCWGTRDMGHMVDFNDFLEYYKDVSPGVISDEVFCRMVDASWKV